MHHCDHGSQYLSIAYTRRLVQEGTRGLRRSRGLLLRQRRRRGPQQVLQTRTRLARRPLEGTRRPRQPRPPDGWTGTTAPAPTSPTTTTSHPQPSNTATITTTPPPHPPPYNQPSTKPGTIHECRVEASWFSGQGASLAPRCLAPTSSRADGNGPCRKWTGRSCASAGLERRRLRATSKNRTHPYVRQCNGGSAGGVLTLRLTIDKPTHP